MLTVELIYLGGPLGHTLYSSSHAGKTPEFPALHLIPLNLSLPLLSTDVSFACVHSHAVCAHTWCACVQRRLEVSTECCSVMPISVLASQFQVTVHHGEATAGTWMAGHIASTVKTERNECLHTQCSAGSLYSHTVQGPTPVTSAAHFQVGSSQIK